MKAGETLPKDKNSMNAPTNCKCMTPPLDYRDFEIDSISNSFGEDQHGGEIAVERCLHCGTTWLRYFVEYPAFTSSGRWCRGVVTDQELAGLTSANALGFLERLPWYLYGGSFFRSTGKVGKGPFRVSP